MPDARLEKVDRDRVRKTILEMPNGYVRTNHGNAFMRDRPDLQGVTFIVEMKREDVYDPWKGCTKKQQAELIAFARGGGRAAAMRLKKGRLCWQAEGAKVKVELSGSVAISTFDFDLSTICKQLLTGENW